MFCLRCLRLVQAEQSTCPGCEGTDLEVFAPSTQLQIELDKRHFLLDALDDWAREGEVPGSQHQRLRAPYVAQLEALRAQVEEELAQAFQEVEEAAQALQDGLQQELEALHEAIDEAVEADETKQAHAETHAEVEAPTTAEASDEESAGAALANEAAEARDLHAEDVEAATETESPENEPQGTDETEATDEATTTVASQQDDPEEAERVEIAEAADAETAEGEEDEETAVAESEDAEDEVVHAEAQEAETLEAEEAETLEAAEAEEAETLEDEEEGSDEAEDEVALAEAEEDESVTEREEEKEEEGDLEEALERVDQALDLGDAGGVLGVPMLGGEGRLTPEQREVVENSTWSRFLRPFLVQNWLYFLGTFLVLASGFYLLSLAWTGMTSLMRQVVIWGVLGGGSLAFAGSGTYLSIRWDLAQGGRMFWLVGMGLLGTSSLAAGQVGLDSGWVSLLLCAGTAAGIGFLTRLQGRLGTGAGHRLDRFSLWLLLGLIALVPWLGASRLSNWLFVLLYAGELILWQTVRKLPEFLASERGELTGLLRWRQREGRSPTASDWLLYVGPVAFVTLLLIGWVGWWLFVQLKHPHALAWFGPLLAWLGISIVELAGFERTAKMEAEEAGEAQAAGASTSPEASASPGASDTPESSEAPGSEAHVLDDAQQEATVSAWGLVAILLGVVGAGLSWQHPPAQLLACVSLSWLCVWVGLRWPRRLVFLLGGVSALLAYVGVIRGFVAPYVWAKGDLVIRDGINGLLFLPFVWLLGGATFWMGKRRVLAAVRGWRGLLFALSVFLYGLLLIDAPKAPHFLLWGGLFYVAMFVGVAHRYSRKWIAYVGMLMLGGWLFGSLAGPMDGAHWARGMLAFEILGLLLWSLARWCERRAAFALLRTVLDEAFLLLLPVCLVLWWKDPLWQFVGVGGKGWTPQTLWLVRYALLACWGVVLGWQGWATGIRRWVYVGLGVLVLGGGLLGAAFPRWWGLPVRPWIPPVVAMCLGFVAFWLSLRLQGKARAPEARLSLFGRPLVVGDVEELWSAPLRHASYLTMALLSWGGLAMHTLPMVLRVGLVGASTLFCLQAGVKRRQFRFGYLFLALYWLTGALAMQWLREHESLSTDLVTGLWLGGGSLLLTFFLWWGQRWLRQGHLHEGWVSVVTPCGNVLPLFVLGATVWLVRRTLGWVETGGTEVSLLFVGWLLFALVCYGLASLLRVRLFVHAGAVACCVTVLFLFQWWLKPVLWGLPAAGLLLLLHQLGRWGIWARFQGGAQMQGRWWLWRALACQRGSRLWGRSHREVAFFFLLGLFPLSAFLWSHTALPYGWASATLAVASLAFWRDGISAQSKGGLQLGALLGLAFWGGAVVLGGHDLLAHFVIPAMGNQHWMLTLAGAAVFFQLIMWCTYLGTKGLWEQVQSGRWHLEGLRQTYAEQSAQQNELLNAVLTTYNASTEAQTAESSIEAQTAGISTEGQAEEAQTTGISAEGQAEEAQTAESSEEDEGFDTPPALESVSLDAKDWQRDPWAQVWRMAQFWSLVCSGLALALLWLTLRGEGGLLLQLPLLVLLPFVLELLQRPSRWSLAVIALVGMYFWWESLLPPCWVGLVFLCSAGLFLLRGWRRWQAKGDIELELSWMSTSIAVLGAGVCLGLMDAFFVWDVRLPVQPFQGIVLGLFGAIVTMQAIVWLCRLQGVPLLLGIWEREARRQKSPTLRAEVPLQVVDTPQERATFEGEKQPEVTDLQSGGAEATEPTQAEQPDTTGLQSGGAEATEPTQAEHPDATGLESEGHPGEDEEQDETSLSGGEAGPDKEELRRSGDALVPDTDEEGQASAVHPLPATTEVWDVGPEEAMADPLHGWRSLRLVAQGWFMLFALGAAGALVYGSFFPQGKMFWLPFWGLVPFALDQLQRPSRLSLFLALLLTGFFWKMGALPQGWGLTGAGVISLLFILRGWRFWSSSRRGFSPWLLLALGALLLSLCVCFAELLVLRGGETRATASWALACVVVALLGQAWMALSRAMGGGFLVWSPFEPLSKGKRRNLKSTQKNLLWSRMWNLSAFWVFLFAVGASMFSASLSWRGDAHLWYVALFALLPWLAEYIQQPSHLATVCAVAFATFVGGCWAVGWGGESLGLFLAHEGGGRRWIAALVGFGALWLLTGTGMSKLALAHTGADEGPKRTGRLWMLADVLWVAVALLLYIGLLGWWWVGWDWLCAQVIGGSSSPLFADVDAFTGGWAGWFLWGSPWVFLLFFLWGGGRWRLQWALVVWGLAPLVFAPVLQRWSSWDLLTPALFWSIWALLLGVLLWKQRAAILLSRLERDLPAGLPEGYREKQLLEAFDAIDWSVWSAGSLRQSLAQSRRTLDLAGFAFGLFALIALIIGGERLWPGLAGWAWVVVPLVVGLGWSLLSLSYAGEIRWLFRAGLAGLLGLQALATLSLPTPKLLFFIPYLSVASLLAVLIFFGMGWVAGRLADGGVRWSWLPASLHQRVEPEALEAWRVAGLAHFGREQLRVTWDAASFRFGVMALVAVVLDAWVRSQRFSDWSLLASGHLLEQLAVGGVLLLSSWGWVLYAQRTKRALWCYVGITCFLGFYFHSRAVLGFDGKQLDVWAMFVLGFLFLGFRVWWIRMGGELLQRAMVRTSLLLPLIAFALAWWSARELPREIWLLSAIFYAVEAYRTRRRLLYLPALLFANVGTFQALWRGGVAPWNQPQYYALPLGCSLFFLSALYGKELSHAGRNGLRLLGGLAIYISSIVQITVFHRISDVLILAALSILGVIAGIALQIRSYLYLGAGFLVVNIGFNLFRIGLRDRVIGMVFLLVVGVLLLMIAVYFNLKRDEILRRLAELREQLAKWD